MADPVNPLLHLVMNAGTFKSISLLLDFSELLYETGKIEDEIML
jgi:hypothetical protein